MSKPTTNRANEHGRRTQRRTAGKHGARTAALAGLRHASTLAYDTRARLHASKSARGRRRTSGARSTRAASPKPGITTPQKLGIGTPQKLTAARSSQPPEKNLVEGLFCCALLCCALRPASCVLVCFLFFRLLSLLCSPVWVRVRGSNGGHREAAALGSFAEV